MKSYAGYINWFKLLENPTDKKKTAKELAIFHASSVILQKNKPNQIPALYNQLIELIAPDSRIEVEINSSIENVLLLLKIEPEKYFRLIGYLELHKFEIVPKVLKLINLKTETSLFNHGDCWRNNILFKATKYCSAIKLIDLQLMRYCSVAADLSYFLFINLTPDLRRNQLDYLLDQYFDSFTHCISEHNIKIDCLPFTREQLRKEMDDFQIFGFVMSLGLAPVLYFDKELLLDMENLTNEQLNPDAERDFFLNNITASMKEYIVENLSDFVEHYKF